MNKILQIGLVALYVLITGISFLFLLQLSGVYVSWSRFFIAMTAWTLACFLSVYIRGPLYLFFQGQLRKPIMEEEIRLQDCLTEVLTSAGCRKKFRLRIIETENETAFACNVDIIAVSRSLLHRLTDDELKGIIAHELGHLISRDTTISWAFVTAGDLPGLVKTGYKFIAPFLRRLLVILVATFFLLLLFTRMFLVPALSVLLFLAIFLLLHRLFRWLRSILSCYCEYKQDAYAHRLGYGAGLRDALKKLARYGRQQVNAYSILMNGTQPIIYNRIRRLETLEGMRNEDQ
jgi:Zn-dependent protease with chaperone function